MNLDVSVNTDNPIEDIVAELLQLWDDDNLYLQYSQKYGGYYINLKRNNNLPALREEFTLQLYPNPSYNITFTVSSYWRDANNQFVVLWVKQCYKYLLPKLIRK